MWFSKKLSKVCKQSDSDDFDDYCDRVDDDGDEKKNIHQLCIELSVI